MFDNWLFCKNCSSEYRVIGAVSNKMSVEFCPFCGSENEDPLEEVEFDDMDI